MKQVQVDIMGQSYLLSCSEQGEKKLRDAVAKVDRAMCQIRDTGKVKARERIAVLAAVNLAFFQDAPTVPADPATDPASVSEASNQTILELIDRIDRLLEQDPRLL